MATHHEGPDAARRFERALGRVLVVSKTELDKREANEKKKRPAKKPRPAR